MNRPITLLELLRRSMETRPAVQTFVVLVLIVCMIGLPCQTTVAGDILRGGTVGANSSTDNRGGAASAAQSLPGAVPASDSLARTAQALQAMQALQTAARNAA